MKKIFILFTCFLMSALYVKPQEGTLDPSFGTQGYNYKEEVQGFWGIALQPDGKIVVVGYTFATDQSNDFVVCRYNANGILDATFGINGFVTTDFGGVDVARSVAIQSDGKLVVAGFTDNSLYGSAFAIARYNTNGSLDETFNEDGLLIRTFFTGFNDYANATAFSIAIQADGKIIVAGSTMLNPDEGVNTVFCVSRLNYDGSPDLSFGGTGFVTTDFIGRDFKDIYSVSIQPDGKIVAAGPVRNSSDGTSDFGVCRYNTDGSPDASFDGDGSLITDFVGGSGVPFSVAIQSDEKIIVAGSFGIASGGKFAISRYNSNGSLDNSFGGDGLVLTDFDGSFSVGRSIALQPDGKIVQVGRTSDSYSYGNLAMTRYNIDGSLDAGFGDNGKVVSDLEGDGDLFAVATSDNRIYAAGTYFPPATVVAGVVIAYKISSHNCTSNSALGVSITDAYSINPGGAANTIYLGYGPSSLTITAQATGGNPDYSYSWSNGQIGSSTTVSPNTVGTHIYTVTVTDATGCISSASKTITVVDIRTPGKPGKVNICHRDLKGKWTTLSVLASSVAEHLLHGDYLGQCVATTSTEAEIITKGSNNQISNESESITKGIKLFPNPASNYINIEWSTKASASTSISIKEVEGRVIKKVQAGFIQQNTMNRKTISLEGLSKGVYILELRTGVDIQVSKFVVQ